MISTPDILGPLLNHSDSFVLIQNGVGVEGALRRRLPTATIISGCSWIDATIAEKGRLLTQYGTVGILFSAAFFLLNERQERLTMGVHPLPDGKPEEKSLELLTDLLLKGGTKPEPESDIVAQRWRKLLWWVPESLLGFDCSLTPQKTQECGVFELVHSFADLHKGAPGRAKR